MNYLHGLSQTPEYKCWQQIKARCLNPNHTAYADYGGRGIVIDPLWVDDFPAFLEHVGPRYSPKHSLDRIDNERGYVVGNVRWTTAIEQNNNRRANRGRGLKVRRVPRTGVVTNWKHGLIHTVEYKTWISMKDRCLNPNSTNYLHWGGRGVTIHPEWINDFKAFYGYMGPRPSSQHTLDRYPNPDGNYEPGNVRWASKREQNLNRRPTLTGPGHGNSTHGLSGSPAHKAWGSIKTRCFNPKHDGYSRYGAVGITMCLRWKEDFLAFRSDLGERPSEEHTVVRVDTSGNYSCGSCEECSKNGWNRNCQWGTRTDQNRNRKLSSRSGKLTSEKVDQIRFKLKSGLSRQVLAKEYQVGVSLVAKIDRHESWR